LIYPHTIFFNGTWTIGDSGTGHPNYPSINAYDGITNGDMAHIPTASGKNNDFKLDVYPKTLTRYIKLWPRVENKCGSDSYCKTVNSRDTTIFLNDDTVECKPRGFYNHAGMINVINSGDSLYYDCPDDVLVHNLRISNNGAKNVHGVNSGLVTWAKLAFQEVQLAYPLECDYISK
jgi:hypothetical protein